MDTEKTLIAAFSDFIAQSTTYRPYPADENIIIPEDDFMSLKLISTEPMSFTSLYERLPSDTCVEEYYTQHEGVIRLTGFGSKAYSLLQQVSRSFRDQRLRNILSVRGVKYFNHSAIRDASVPIYYTKIEKRYTMVIQFYFIPGGESIPGLESTIDTVQPPVFQGDYNT